MMEFAVGASVVLAFFIWFHHSLTKVKEELNVLIEENDEETRKHIETKFKQCAFGSEAKKPSPGKEYYYEK